MALLLEKKPDLNGEAVRALLAQPDPRGEPTAGLRLDGAAALALLGARRDCGAGAARSAQACPPQRLLNCTCLRSLVFAAASLLVGQVDAQVSASVAALSDYRFRGISQSDNNPALQATLAFDHTTGLFASAFASSVDFGGGSDANVETVLAAGYAARCILTCRGKRALCTTAIRARALARTDYAEGFAGVTWRNVNARFHVTPHYFGGGRSALYAELNATFALSERLAVTAHAGFARITGLYNRLDVSTSILIDLRHATLELAAVATDIPSAECPLARRLAGRGLWRCCRGAFSQIERAEAA